jgi:hypothetical protein
VSRGENDDLGATQVEERIRADQQRCERRLYDGGEGRVDLAIGAGGQHADLPPDGGSSRLHVFDDGAGDSRGARIDQQAKVRRGRQQLLEQPEPFSDHSASTAANR